MPVLLEEVLETLAPGPGEQFLDLTVGAGGHSAAIARRLGEEGTLIGIDRDPSILALAAERLPPSAKLFHGNFADVARLRSEWPVERFDGVLADLGVSSLQLDAAERGFSFRSEARLDMRMDPSDAIDAEAWLASVSVEELTTVIAEYGEERYAKRVAAAIVRERGRIRTTTELGEVIRAAIPAKSAAKERIHPATRTFQAIRIAVNRELEALDRLLQLFPVLLRPGGRFGVISFHSLEDRRVKQAFRARVDEGSFEAVTPKPVRPSASEIESNPRARSARLRVVKRK